MKNKAFSLLEIMVVVIIVGILSGIALPQYLKTVELRKVDVAKQQLKQIETAVDFLQNNNKSYSFCETAEDCDTTEEINTALELDIQNDDFNFHVGGDLAGATRRFGPKCYQVVYQPNASGVYTCFDPDDGACAWIHMTREWFILPYSACQ